MARRIDINKEVFGYYTVQPFKADLVIFFGKDYENIRKHLNLKKNKAVSDYLKREVTDIKIPDGSGGMFYNVETEKPLILFMRNDGHLGWGHYETLIHELNHIVEAYSRFFGFRDEYEFKAYLQEMMFRDIRRIIEK